MKAQGWRHQIDKRSSRLQLDAVEVAVSLKISLVQMPSNAQPVVRRLQRQMQRLCCLQLDNCQPARACDAEHVENSLLVPRPREHLGINESWIERRIDPRNVLAHEGFQPALRAGTIQRMPCIRG